MDIYAWLRNTKDRQPPDQLSPTQPYEITQTQLRERSYDLQEILARQGLKHDRSRSRGHDLEAQQISKHAYSHEHKRRREIQGQIDGSSSDLREVVELGPYDRKPRRKTRIDLYETKMQVNNRKSRIADGSTKLSTKRAKAAAQEMAGREKRDDSKRLALQPDVRFGLYRHGRSSAHGSARRSGLPDLVFNEMKFLQEPMQIEGQSEPDPYAAKQNSMQNDVVSAFFKKAGRVAGNQVNLLQQEGKAVSERQEDPPELCSVRHKRGHAQQSAEVDVDLLTRSAHARNVTSSSLPRVRSFARQADSNQPQSQQILSGPRKERHIRHEAYPDNPRSASRTNISRYPLNTDGALSLLRARCESDTLEENNHFDIAREVGTAHHVDLATNNVRSGKSDTIRDELLLHTTSHKSQYAQESPFSGGQLDHSMSKLNRKRRYRTSDILNIAWNDGSTDGVVDSRYERQPTSLHQNSLSPRVRTERYLAHNDSLEIEEELLQSRFDAFKKDILVNCANPIVDSARTEVGLPSRGLVSLETQRQSIQRNVSTELQPSVCRIRLWNTERAPSLLNDSAMSICHSRSGNHQHKSLKQDSIPHDEPRQRLPSFEASMLDDAHSLMSESLHFSSKTHTPGNVIVKPLQAARPFSKPNILY